MFWNKYKNKKIGIFYICTGKYDIFWNQFYESAEKFLCPELEKHYFVFTDSEQIKEGKNISKIHQQRLGWPDDTLMRFHMFIGIKEKVIDMDYLFFFNANIQFRKKIKPNEILPNNNEQLVAVIHPYYYDGPQGAPYENNILSLAYANPDMAKHYVQGCLNGGLTKHYMSMAEQLAANIDRDKQEGIIAKWHDESHLNAYMIAHSNYKVLNPGYAKPDGRKGLPFKERIVQLDKEKFGGHTFLRS
jgi:hypothetical protein